MRTEFYYDDNEEGDGGIAGIRVVLSRDNAEELLAKRSLEGPTSCFPTIVTVEDNDVHQNHPRTDLLPPARLHPDIESHSR